MGVAQGPARRIDLLLAAAHDLDDMGGVLVFAGLARFE